MDGQALSLDARATIPRTERQHAVRWNQDLTFEVAPGVAGLAESIVNLFFIGRPGAESRSWFLVDAGLPFSATSIRAAAAARFGNHSEPAAILLTHGHFDHVGAIVELAEHWNVPVYVHPLEMPYVTGRSSYPPPDPAVGGGGMSLLSRFYPRGPIDLGRRAIALPPDGSIPAAPEWRWIHTPGHTPGHVSFFRESDRTLLVGDAFVTTRQESALSALFRWPKVWRPPAYYTTDWTAARQSIERLAELQPNVAATGHGLPLYGRRLNAGLKRLLDDWEQIAPSYGRYVNHPALTDETGVIELPPPVLDWQLLALGAAALSLGGLLLAMQGKFLDTSPPRKQGKSSKPAAGLPFFATGRVPRRERT